MSDFRALVRNGQVNQLQDNADSLIVGAGIKTASGDLTITPAGTNIVVPASKLLTTTGTGNINLPRNASANFNIEGVAVSNNVTAANLGTLTAGPASNADALHTHTGGGGATYTYTPLVGRQYITLANSLTEETAGSNAWRPAEQNLTGTVKLRAVLRSSVSGTNVRIKLWSRQDNAFVTPLTGGVDYLQTTSATATTVLSSDLSAATNFTKAAPGDGYVYDLIAVSTDTSAQAVVGYAELVCGL